MKRFKSIRIGVSNLIYWLPIIWNDRQWDYNFFLRILFHKLRRMQFFFESDDVHLENQHIIADQICSTAILSERLYENKYLAHALEPHVERWGKPELILNYTDDEYAEYCGFWFDNAHNYEENDKAYEEYFDMIYLSRKRQERDLISLFDQMKQNIFEWWD